MVGDIPARSVSAYGNFRLRSTRTLFSVLFISIFHSHFDLVYIFRLQYKSL